MSQLPTDNREFAREKAKRLKEAAAQREGDILTVVGTAEGRRVWLWLRDYVCNPLASSADAEARAKADGRREVAAVMRQVLLPHTDARLALLDEQRVIEEREAEFQVIAERLRRETAPREE